MAAKSSGHSLKGLREHSYSFILQYAHPVELLNYFNAYLFKHDPFYNQTPQTAHGQHGWHHDRIL